MDFQSMKRKQLQALCKKNGIPANLTNLELAERLGVFFKEIEKLDDVDGEIESVEVEKKVVKKVRFCPHDEVFEIRNSSTRVAGRRAGRSKKLSLLESDDNVAKNDDLDKKLVKRLTRKSVAISSRALKSVVDERLSNGVEDEIGGKKGGIVRRSKRSVAVAGKDEDSEALEEELDRGEDGRMITRLRNKFVVKGVSSGAGSGKAVKNVVATDEQDEVALACAKQPELMTSRRASKRKSVVIEDQVLGNTELIVRDVIRSMNSLLEEDSAESEPSGNLLKPSKKDMLLPDGGLRRSQRIASSFYASAVIGHAGVRMESSQATERQHSKEKVPPEQASETVKNVRRSGRNVLRDDSLATLEKKEKEVLTSNENHNDKNVARTRRKQVVSVEQVSKIEQEPPVKISPRRSASISSKHDSNVNARRSLKDEPEIPLLEVKADRNIKRTRISKKRTSSSKRQNKLESEEGSLVVFRDDEEIAKDKKSKKRCRSKKKDNCIEVCAVSSEVDEERDALVVNEESSTLESPMKLLDAPDIAETPDSHESENISSAKEKEKVVQMDAFMQDEEDCRSEHNGLLDGAGPEALIPVERELSPEEILSPSKSFSPSEPVEDNQVNDTFKEKNLMVEKRDAITREAERPLSCHRETHCQVMCGEEIFCKNDSGVSNALSKLPGGQEEDDIVVDPAPALEQEEAFSPEDEAIHKTMTGSNIKSGSNRSGKIKGSGEKENEDEETPEKRLILSVSAVNNGGEVFEENLVENSRQKVILVETLEDGLLDNKENTVLELESINLLGAALHLGTQISDENSEILVEKDRLCMGKEKENEIQMYYHGQKNQENSMAEKLVSPERELSPDEIVSPLKGSSPSEISVTFDRNVDILTRNEELESEELSASELRLTSYGVEKYYQRSCGDEKLCSNSADGFYSPSELQEEEQCFEAEPCSEGKHALVQKDEIFDGTSTMPEGENLPSDIGAERISGWDLREPSGAKEEEEERTAEKWPVTPISIMDNNDEFLGENLIKNSGPLVGLDEVSEDELLVGKESLGSETSLDYSSPKDRVGTLEASIEEAASDALQGIRSDSIQSLDKISIMQETNSDMVKFLHDGPSIKQSGSHSAHTNRSACKHGSLSASVVLPTDQCEAPTSTMNSLDRRESFLQPLKCRSAEINCEDQEDFCCADEMQTRLEKPSESELEKDVFNQEICTSALLPAASDKLRYEEMLEWFDDRSNIISSEQSFGSLTTEEQREYTATFDNDVRVPSPQEMCIANSSVYAVNKILYHDIAKEVPDDEDKILMTRECSGTIGYYLAIVSTEVDPAICHYVIEEHQGAAAEMTSSSCTGSAEKNCEGSEDPEENGRCKMIELDMPFEEETRETTESGDVMSLSPQVSDFITELGRLTPDHDPSSRLCTCSETLLSEVMEEKNSVLSVREVSTMDVLSDRQINAPSCSDLDHLKIEVVQEETETYLVDGSSARKSVVKTPEETDMSMNVDYSGISTGLTGMFHDLEDQLPKDAELTVDALHFNAAHEDASCSEGLYDIYVEIVQHPDGDDFGELDVLKGLIPEATTIFYPLNVENVETIPEEEDIQTVSRNGNLTDQTFVQDKVNADVSQLSTHVKCCQQQGDKNVLDGKLRSSDAIINYLENNSRVSIDKVAEDILESAFINGCSADQVQRTSKSTTRSDNSCEVDLNIAEVNLFNSASRVKFDSGSGNQLESVYNKVAEVVEWKELIDDARDEGMTTFEQGTNDFDEAGYDLRLEVDLNRPQDVPESHSDGHKEAERETDPEPLELNEPLCKTESKLDLEESLKALDALQYLFDEVVHEESDTSAECLVVSSARSSLEHVYTGKGILGHEGQPDVCTGSLIVNLESPSATNSGHKDVKQVEDVYCPPSSFTQIRRKSSPDEPVSGANPNSEINDATRYPEKATKEAENPCTSVQNEGPVTLVREDTKSDGSITPSDNAEVKVDNAAIEKSNGIKDKTESNESTTSLRPSSTTAELHPGDLAMDIASEGDRTASSLMMEMKIIGTNSRLETPKKLSWTQGMKENATAGFKKEATNIKSVIKRRALEKIQNF